MPTRSARALAGAVAIAVVAIAVVAIAVVAIAAVGATAAPARGQYGGDDGETVTETEHGPLGPGDRDLLVRVRYAGLWEMPAGELAAERGGDERVREIGRFIADEHAELDERVREVAGQLGVELPDQPMAQHQAFLDRMADASGPDFDLIFVQLLREAHGEVYPLIAYARAGTQNDLVRQFAVTAEEFIGRHLEYLESTGLVDWIHIPPPPGPGGTHSRFLGTQPAGVHPVLIWLILGAAAVAGTITVVRTVRPR
jgi:predicted outer membrane protein